MQQILVNKNDAGQRIDKFLTKKFKNLPVSLMYKKIRTKDIKINSKRCYNQTKLNQGDLISVYINDDILGVETEQKDYDFLKAPAKLEIVYEDRNILILNKKAGLIVHPDENYFFDSLIARVQRYLYEKKEYDPEEENSFAPALVNRIDRNTKGLVIAAKNAESLRILNEKLKNREIKKFYLCIVCGIIKDREQTLKAFLEKNEKKNRVYIFNEPKPNTKTILTKYKLLKEQENLRLLEVELLTGRTHQIRAHMAFIGAPLLGDGKYGRNSINKKYAQKHQALFSYKLKFAFDQSAGILDYLNGKTFIVQVPKKERPWNLFSD